MRYTAVFEFDGAAPGVSAGDGWKGGKLCAVSFSDEFFALEKLREVVEAIADGDGDPQEMAIQTLELLTANASCPADSQGLQTADPAESPEESGA
jgi:hypothetical protein